MNHFVICRNKKSPCFPQVDQFAASEFFISENGLFLNDAAVFARAQSDPELRVKIQDYLVEGSSGSFASSADDDDVFDSIHDVENRFFNEIASIRDKAIELQNNRIKAKENVES